MTVSSNISSVFSVVANVLWCDILVSEFKINSRYYANFLTNTLEKDLKTLIPDSYGLNKETKFNQTAH